MAVAGHLTLFVCRSRSWYTARPYPAPIMIWASSRHQGRRHRVMRLWLWPGDADWLGRNRVGLGLLDHLVVRDGCCQDRGVQEV